MCKIWVSNERDNNPVKSSADAKPFDKANFSTFFAYSYVLCTSCTYTNIHIICATVDCSVIYRVGQTSSGRVGDNTTEHFCCYS